jgi:hypothetical protein
MLHFVASRLHDVTGEPLLPAELELLDAANVLVVEAQKNYQEILQTGDAVSLERCRREVTVAFEWAALLTCDVMAGKLRGGVPKAGEQKKPASEARPPAAPELDAPREH